MAKILSCRPISKIIRLKELIQERCITSKEFVHQFNIWKESNEKYKEINDIGERDVSRWLTKRVRLTDQRLQQFADFFDVDLEYLKCFQTDRRKVDFSKFDDLNRKEFVKSVKEHNKFIDYLNVAGYKVEEETSPIAGEVETFEVIDDEHLYTIEDLVATEFEYSAKIVSLEENKTYDLTYEQFNDFHNECKAFIKFKLDYIAKSKK